MKRTCNRCRALSGPHCDLGYGVAVKRYHGGLNLDEMKPTEECPKPLTYKAWLELKDAARLTQNHNTEENHL